MKSRKNHIVVLFSILSIINIVIFFYRDKFSFHKYATYSTLYSADTIKWKKIINDYPKQELVEAKAILDSLQINHRPTPVKVVEIGRFLYNHFHKQLGHSSDQLVSASPLNQYKILRSSDTTQLWCGNFSEMFAFFCWSEGIACRVIEIMNPGDHHVLNECYLPEIGQWAVTDLTNNNLFILNDNRNSYANLLSLRDSSWLTVSTLQATDRAIVLHPLDTKYYDKYFDNKNPIYYYYRVNNFEIYKPIQKIKRYFLPDAWYEEVSNNRRSNWPFYIKQFFTLLWLIVVPLLIGQLVSPKSKS